MCGAEKVRHMLMGEQVLKKWKKMELITIASAGCALAYAAGACFGNSMYYTTPYFYMFLGMTARTIKLKNTK